MLNKLTKFEKTTIENEFEVSYREHRSLIKCENKKFSKDRQLERLIERKNYYRLLRKWKCPKCGSKLKYDSNGACASEGLEEWIECVNDINCNYSRDLNSDDIDLVYGFR